MTVCDYDALHELEQEELFWKHGIHVGDRVEGEYIIVLFQVLSFYVELFYNIEDNALEKVRSFSGTGDLEIYLKHIDLAELHDFKSKESRFGRQ